MDTKSVNGKNGIHPHRRWRVFSKDELDGFLTPEQRSASAMRKKNREIEGRRRAKRRQQISKNELVVSMHSFH